ncbi:MAG: hypothetical protein RID91_02635 [Azospirillaceae bacterium]
MSLPEALAALSDADRAVDGFDQVMAHQAMPWFCLLVQLGAIAVDRAAGGTADAPGPTAAAPMPARWTDPAAWAESLRALTPGHDDDAPWCLVVPDPAKPAFLQPPTPKTGLDRHRTWVETPDGIDLPVTAKNHDIKAGRRAAASPAEWLYALTTVQTFGGFSGRGNQGVARMNGGFGSRAVATRMPADSVTWGARFRRDLKVLLRQRTGSKPPDWDHRAGRALLWLEPWDDETTLPVRDLDPHFVEIARHLRLTAQDGGLAALFRPSETPRLAAKAYKGLLDDPWMPVAPGKDGAQALTVGPAGWTATRVAQILLNEDGYARPEAQKALRGESPKQGSVFAFSVLVRGQGTTDGFHERRVGLPPEVVELLDGEPGIGQAIYKALAKPMLDLAGNAGQSVLLPALLMLMQGPTVERGASPGDRRAEPWLQRFDREADQAFFDTLAQEVMGVRDDIRADTRIEDLREMVKLTIWRRQLYTLAETLFDEATRSGLTIAEDRRERAIARARLLFDAKARAVGLREDTSRRDQESVTIDGENEEIGS